MTLEAGEPGRLQSAQVREGTAGIVRLLDAMQIVNRVNLLRGPRPVYYRSTWVRSDHGGILFSLVRLGQLVAAGDILGTVTDPITNEQNLIYSPVGGRVVGMALNQVVMPGFATFNLGIEAGSGPNGSLMEALEPPPQRCHPASHRATAGPGPGRAAGVAGGTRDRERSGASGSRPRTQRRDPLRPAADGS